MPRRCWEMETCTGDANGSRGWGTRIDDLLADGWEPYAVVVRKGKNNDGERWEETMHYLRREVSGVPDAA